MSKQDSQDFRAAIRILLISELLAIVLGAAACSRHWDKADDGQVKLTFKDVSDVNATFTLANGLERSISVRGSRTITFAIKTWPYDAGIECEARDHAKRAENPIGVADGKSRTFEVESREVVRLVVPSELPNRFRGGACWLRLMLQDGTVIGPVEFHP